MASYNKIILMGRAGADPEIVNFSNGGKLAKISLSEDVYNGKNPDGSKNTVTVWHRLEFVGDANVNLCERYVKKGSSLLVEGRLIYNKYKNKAGEDVTAAIIRVNSFTFAGGSGNSGESKTSGLNTPNVESDDDLPF